MEATIERPDYWHPEHFKSGDRVKYGEFPATVIRHYHEGMWEIWLGTSGVACVTGADLRRFSGPPAR